MPPGLNRVSNGLYQVIPVQSIPKTGNPALSGTNSKGEQVPLLTTPEVTPVKTVSPKKFGSPTSPPPTFPQDHPWTYAEKFSPLRTSRGRYSPGKSVTGAEIALGRFEDWGTPLESSSNQVAPPASLMAQYVPLAACFRTDSDSERANLPQSRRLKKKRRRVTEEHPMQNANDEKSDSRKKYRERDFLEVDQKATNELETGSLREHSAPFTQAQETTVACEPPVTSSILSAGQCGTGELSDVAMPEQFSPQTCAYRILGLDTKELTSRIMRDFEHHSDGEEHLTQSDEFSEESSEDSSSQGESHSDDSLMEEEARDSEYLDPHEQAVIQFVYLRNNTTSRGSGSQSRSSDTGSDGIYTPSTSTTTNQCGRDQSKGKKRRSDGGDDPGGKKPREDEKLNVAKTASDTKKLACPYYKKSGGNPKTASCVFPGFSSVSRMKEHLYRTHRRPIACPRCCSQFASQGGLDAHIIQPRRCIQALNTPVVDGFGLDQERQLKSKRRMVGVNTEEDKWRAVYRILFPDDIEVPSPYSETDFEGSNFSRTIDFSSWEGICRDRLPLLVRQTLEETLNREIQAIEESLRNQLPAIFRSAREQLFSSFMADSVNSIRGQMTVEQDQADQIPHVADSISNLSSTGGNQTTEGFETAHQVEEDESSENLVSASASAAGTSTYQPFTSVPINFNHIDPSASLMQNQLPNSIPELLANDNSNDQSAMTLSTNSMVDWFDFGEPGGYTTSAGGPFPLIETSASQHSADRVTNNATQIAENASYEEFANMVPRHESRNNCFETFGDFPGDFDFEHLIASTAISKEKTLDSSRK
ncbi:hypothetical protein HDK90DRAFT_106652 [Phyllosticta capitalensis]|uniref:C2H2-type domain-containing protein n=1 Tax=Phyllosticta capitalensis TaxID=121624 RepID=A0ABR1YBE9_9PEZI